MTNEPSKPYLLWITSMRDGRDHAVSDAELDTGSKNGHYRALCGHDVIPTAMTAPPGQRCPNCALQRAVRTRVDPATDRSTPRFMARLTSWIRAAVRTTNAAVQRPAGQVT